MIYKINLFTKLKIWILGKKAYSKTSKGEYYKRRYYVVQGDVKQGDLIILGKGKGEAHD